MRIRSFNISPRSLGRPSDWNAAARRGCRRSLFTRIVIQERKPIGNARVPKRNPELTPPDPFGTGA